MKCEDFERIAAAIVDGECDADVRADAERHIASCSSCFAGVEYARSMRAAIGRVFPVDRAPDSLVASVRAAIETESRSTPQATSRPSRWTTPLAVAAAVAFLWVGSVVMERWQAPESSIHVAAAARWVSDARQTHAECIKAGPKHHDERFPRELSELGEKLSKAMGFPLVVPDLSEYGFRLQSADTCGIGQVPGAHLIYEHHPDGELLSLFTVSRQAGLAGAAESRTTARDCFVCEKGTCTVVAWHASEATYVFCGGIAVKKLVAIVESIR